MEECSKKLENSSSQLNVIEDNNLQEIEVSRSAEEELEPRPGMIFYSFDILFQNYKSYASKMGFEAIIRSSNKGEDGKLKFATLSCSCSGKSSSTSRNAFKKHPVTKTDCKARIGASALSNGQWQISSIALEHNHELSSPGKTRFFKSNRIIQPCVKRKLEVNDRAGIRPNKNFNSFVVEAGGAENLSFLQKDCRNYIEKARRLRLGDGDASAIQKYFLKMQKENSKFRGILCRHAIVVLIHKEISHVPEKYVLRRWSKNINRCHSKVKISYDSWSTNLEGQRFDKLSNLFLTVADLASNNEDDCNMVVNVINDLKKKLMLNGSVDENEKRENISAYSRTTCENVDEASKEGSNHILTPRAVRSKGRPPIKRRQSKVEQIIRKVKEKTTKERK